ncbi:hypothetical protein IX83_00755 [Basilea psittacipulmonis DSM 24701]|uniref:Porin opacity type domain-containing protein n=2 Tax=Basilea TaxID=1472344 RepID=A0A077DCZ9_9BURK|nr:hypothetical protein IX83_00755 [Basilea psittacipulmonis DSM 24701]
MKRKLLAALLGLDLATCVSAEPIVFVETGYSKLNVKVADVKLNDNNLAFTIGGGYRFEDINLRLLADYSYYGQAKGSYKDDANTFGTIKTKVSGLGVSAILDIPADQDLTTYLGVRFSANHIDYSENGKDEGDAFTEKSNHRKFGYGLLLGARYTYSRNWDAHLGVEFNNIPKFDNVRIRQFGIKLGTSYRF